MKPLGLSRRAPAWLEDCVDSTNLVLRRMADEAADGTAVAALAQSAGRGRSGRSFLSPEGGLYLSMLLRPQLNASELPTLTAVAAVAVCRAIEALCAVRCGIKWPNDVVLQGKKICGILVESIWKDDRPCAIVGIGVNANTDAFPEELREIAGSIRQLTGQTLELEALAAALIGELDRQYELWLAERSAALAEYRARCISSGREVLVDGRRAMAEEVCEDYALLVRYDDGTRQAVRFGEVSVRGLYGYV